MSWDVKQEQKPKASREEEVELYVNWQIKRMSFGAGRRTWRAPCIHAAAGTVKKEGLECLLTSEAVILSSSQCCLLTEFTCTHRVYCCRVQGKAIIIPAPANTFLLISQALLNASL